MVLRFWSSGVASSVKKNLLLRSPVSDDQRYKQRRRRHRLRKIRVLRSLIRHADQPSPRELEPLIELVRKHALVIDTFSASPSAGRVTRLSDEVWDDAVKDETVVESFEAQLNEASASKCLAEERVSEGGTRN